MANTVDNLSVTAITRRELLAWTAGNPRLRIVQAEDLDTHTRAGWRVLAAVRIVDMADDEVLYVLSAPDVPSLAGR